VGPILICCRESIQGTFARSRYVRSRLGSIWVIDGDLWMTGSAVSGNAAGGRGGGILVYAGDLSVTGSTVRGNTASLGGGGIFSDREDSMTTLLKMLFL
jgi:hypothetical protein